MADRSESPGTGTLKGTGFFSQLFFTWIQSVLTFGSKNIIEQQDIPELDERMKSMKQFSNLSSNLQSEFNKVNKNKEGMSLIRAMFRTCKSLIYPIIITAIVAVSISMAVPYVTRVIIKYIQSGNKQVSTGIMYVAGILLMKFIQNLAESRLYYNITVMGYSLCNTLSVCIFQKATRYPTLCSKKYTVAQLINYSQVDAQRLTYLGYYTTSVLFIPFQLGIGIFMLYSFIGVSFLAGFGIIVIIGIFVFIINKLMTKANDALLKAKDKRMKITNQIFNHIRFIKANAWQKYFFNKLNKARDFQLSKLKVTLMYGVTSILFLWITTPLILSSIFGMYTALGNKLTAETAFTTIVLFNMLQFPLRTLPQAISQLNQIWVSAKRIENFLAEKDIDKSYIEKGDEQFSQNSIEIRRGTFYWEEDQKKQQDQKKLKQIQKQKKKLQKQKKKQEKRQKKLERQQSLNSDIVSQSETQTESQIKKSLLSDSGYAQQKKMTTPYIKALKNVHIQIKKGKFTIILGNIGAGKSSLLYSILGQMIPFPQSNAHIQLNGSVAMVVQKAWMLSKSIQQNILMGEEKSNTLFQQSIKYSCLSDDLKQLPDAQKTIIGEKGINLSGGQKARVNLARALYSNRDIYLLDDIISAVDIHVGNTIVKECLMNYLKTKTRVLVTHAISYAKYADEIIIMRKGQIVERGAYQQIKNTTYFTEIQQLEEKGKLTQQQQTNSQKNPIIQSKIEQKENQYSKDIVVQQSTTNKLVEELLMPEDRVRGDVELKTWKNYVDLNGGWSFVFAIFFFMSCWIVLSTLANIQIEKWCQNPEQSNKSLYIYIAFSVSSAFFAFARAFVLVFSGIRQGRIAHKKMIKGLLYSSIPQFYDRVPIGRILNRVTKDLKQLDQDIGYTIGNTVVYLFTLLGSLVICVYASTPYVLIPVAIFIVICFFLKNYYLKSQREITRLQNITSSPIVSSFNQIMNGLSTIRAYQAEQKFLQRQCQFVDVNKKNRICKQAVDIWFSLRLSFLSYIVNILAIAFCIIGANDNPSLAGLLFAYSFTIDECVVNLIYNMGSIETKMVSVERVTNFMNIEPQKGYQQYTKKWRTRDQQPLKLINEGRVEFKDFCLKYRQNLPNVLNGLNMEIQPGQKIGVVGRTGAGKSTLIQAILRTIQPSSGQLLIDGMEITSINLKSLRSNVTLIAQEPVMIAGTLRQNLDPRNQHTDQQLKQALQKCYLIQTFQERQMLDSVISQSGENLSIGEKQLICIARAILRDNKLVLIDQATANIDMKSDQLIQQTIRKQFSKSTVITIAHRIKTILHSDRILVMDKGRIKEFDTPDNLLQRKGVFYEMYTKSQEQNQL